MSQGHSNDCGRRPPLHERMKVWMFITAWKREEQLSMPYVWRTSCNQRATCSQKEAFGSFQASTG
eukprot:1158993-Pelagomonas_calceolata.AAC.2